MNCDSQIRSKNIKNAGLAGMFGNILLLIIKSTIGFTCHSQSMIADAFNSASDILASLMTFIGNKISSEPKDDDHNFGHGKAEYIFSLFISITMILVSAKLLIDSIKSLFSPEKLFVFSWFLIVVSIATIVIKFSLFIYTYLLNKKYDSILLKSSYTDHRNDCVLTTFTLISIICAYYGIFWVDGVVGIGISLWIIYAGYCIFMESYNVLMDLSLDDKSKDIILDLISEHDTIQNCYNFYSTPVGNKYLVMFTIVVDGNMSTHDSHEIANHLEKDVEAMDKIYKAIVHVHPSNL